MIYWGSDFKSSGHYFYVGVRYFVKSYKTEIDLTDEQRTKVLQTMGTCRFCYNLFIDKNKEFRANGEKYLDANKFSVWFNNEYLPKHSDLFWVKEVSSKSVKHAFENADNAFKRFFKKQSGFPKFKKKSRNNVSMYFVKNNANDCICERHKIKIPTLGWVKLKECGYIPTDNIISSGCISIKAGRFYISCLVKEEPNADNIDATCSDGIGIDLGIKDTAIISNGKVYKNINKSKKVKKLKKKLKREQRKLSRKFIKGGKPSNNYKKQKLEVQKVYQRFDNIRDDFERKMINEIVRTKPSYIVIEDLNVSGMMKNRHLSKAVQEQRFYSIVTHLAQKCKENGIELRKVDRFYPSSKTCHNCGCVKTNLKLSDRTFVCEDCGFVIDRDLNASLNLRDCENYTVA